VTLRKGPFGTRPPKPTGSRRHQTIRKGLNQEWRSEASLARHSPAANHLVVLGVTTAESFPVYGNTVAADADGSSPLMKGDKSAAQIVAFDGGVMYSEKSGFVSTLSEEALNEALLSLHSAINESGVKVVRD
jgi:hypothetical protein